MSTVENGAVSTRDALTGAAPTGAAPTGTAPTGTAAVEGIDDVLHLKPRLGIMTALFAAGGESDFRSLKDQLKMTDGNLGAHIRVLETAGYLEVEKSFVGRRPRTLCRVSEAGRAAFLRYLKQLEEVILAAGAPQRSR
jgi:DNA-binding MarR family transcriptional regulator